MIVSCHNINLTTGARKRIFAALRFVKQDGPLG